MNTSRFTESVKTAPSAQIAEISRDLAPVWCEVFGDDIEFVSEALELIKDGAICSVIKDGDAVLSQAIAFHLSLEGIRGLYVYGVATAPEHRGKGYAREVISRLCEYARESSMDFVTLIPQSAELSDMYRKMGFTHESPLLASAEINSPLDVYATVSEPATELCEDYGVLYDRTGAYMDYGCFVYAIKTLGRIKVFLTDTGYFISHADDSDRVIACSMSLVPSLKTEKRGYALSMLLTPLPELPITISHPLPR